MTLDDFLRVCRALPEAMLLVEKGVVVAANPACQDVFGGPATPGAPITDLFAEPSERITDYLRLASRTLEMIPVTLNVRGPAEPIAYFVEGCRLEASTRVVIMLRLRPRVERLRSFQLLNEKIDALTGQILNRQAIEAQLRRAIEQAETANRLKDEFLATLSHELRTPLNAIVGWVHLLRAGGLDDATHKRAIETIARNAELQNQLIADILDVSSIMAGKFRLNLQECNWITLIETAVDTVRPSADAKQIDIKRVLDPDAAPMFGDPGRLLQIIWNLLSNAIKFTPKQGRVRIGLCAVNSHVELTIEDTGPGIAPEFLPYIFDRFRQADSSVARRHGGLGLGLAIVRSLTELHGGTVSATNRQTGGAAFILSFPRPAVSRFSPLAPEDGPRRHPRAGDLPQLPGTVTALHGVKVLVVEDDTEGRELVASLLERYGAEVITARSAVEGLEAVQRHLPNVILSDIGMPGIDGYEFLTNVRALPPERGGHIPAAALTAYASTSDRTRILEAGFRVHVAKPVQPSELLAVVRNLAFGK